ncbi:hypothetical protein N431DRAFT_324183 [Stipitochalara longipes BDJ]|nr:hypothetical protein N431DRAFT_324183 [Stipitochalara longipes BDJ]
MLSLLGSGAGDSKALSTINEHDPFIGPPRSRAATVYNNPFAPKPQASPYAVGNHLIGPPSGPSPHLRALTSGGTRLPSLNEALDPSNFPFVEICRRAKEENFGVIKIKNIPYGVTRPEILAFLGRNARIINEQEYEPVHIVMERVTSKTLDCYVEFTNLNEAVNAVNRFDSNRAGNRGGRLGSRHVDVELASQEQLMKDLFPKAKNVTWQGSRPIIAPNNPHDQFNSGFQGFISKEELVMLVKHVEAPQRSPFSKECPQRPFECLISTLLKYPWYMVDHITIADRSLLHKATIDLIKLLQERIDSGADPVNLNNQLFKRVWRAALKCPGFTPVMKDDVVFICGIDDRTALELGVAPYAVWWKPLFTIGHKPEIPADTLMWYVAIIREHLDRKKAYESLAERAARNAGNEMPKLFGDLDKIIERPDGWWDMTLGQIARHEWTAIEHVLREILTPALEGRK